MAYHMRDGEADIVYNEHHSDSSNSNSDIDCSDPDYVSSPPRRRSSRPENDGTSTSRSRNVNVPADHQRRRGGRAPVRERSRRGRGRSTTNWVERLVPVPIRVQEAPPPPPPPAPERSTDDENVASSDMSVDGTNTGEVLPEDGNEHVFLTYHSVGLGKSIIQRGQIVAGSEHHEKGGVVCFCCNKQFADLVAFDRHANSNLAMPYEKKFSFRIGVPLLACLASAWSRIIRGEDDMVSTDDPCTICASPGENLIECNTCCYTFHHNCLGMEVAFPPFLKFLYIMLLNFVLVGYGWILNRCRRCHNENGIVLIAFANIVVAAAALNL